MGILFKKTFLTVMFIALFLLILIYPQVSFSYAAAGLTLWFNQMVPTLFPFMILSTLLIRQNLTGSFISLLYPLLGRLYGIGINAVYCLLLGFLCGFPMGARTIGELYGANKITKREASLLLSFCNNIGLVYFIGFVLPVTGLTQKGLLPLFLFGMYGIPLLYGLFVHVSGFLIPKESASEKAVKNLLAEKESAESFTLSLDRAIDSGIHAITALGGYMIVCNLLNLFPFCITKHFSPDENGLMVMIVNCLLEISGGISRMGRTAPLCSLILLHLGGLSCLLQTKSMIKHTDLSLQAYIIHKALQTLLTAVYYFFLRFFLL